MIAAWKALWMLEQAGTYQQQDPLSHLFCCLAPTIMFGITQKSELSGERFPSYKT